MGWKPTVVLDYDGVMTQYSGWKGEDVAEDPPVPGMKEAIAELQKDYRIVIVSTRCRTPEGRAAIEGWLERNGFGIFNLELMAEKPPAMVYVDDRAICFRGDAWILPHQIRTFTTWTQEKKP